MNFPSSLIRQPPVPDKDHNNDFQYYQDDFTITKQKGLKGFNDDVSEIELGSWQFNEDSINEIKRQQKLLSGQQDYSKRYRLSRFDSKEFSVQDQQFQLQVPFQVENGKIQFKSPKQYIEPQSVFKHSHTPYFPSIHRVNSLGQKNMFLIPSFSMRNVKKSHTEILHNLAELKKLKSQIKQLFYQEEKKYKQFIYTYRNAIQNEIKKSFVKFAQAYQIRLANNLRKSQKVEQIALKSKLKQNQDFVKEMQKQLEQLCQQNQSLQEKVFDLQQKIIGVDLEVEEKFQSKKKQLQSKIFQEVTSKQQSSSFAPPQDRNSDRQAQYNTNKESNELIQSLVKQNQFLQTRVKTYETMLLETEQLRKMKQILEEKQFLLGQKQTQIETRNREVQRTFKQAGQRSMDLGYAEESLNRQLIQLKESLRLKQEGLAKWQEQLMMKANSMNEKEDEVGYAQKRYPQDFAISAFNIPSQNHHHSKNINFRSPSDQAFSQKISNLSSEKIQRPQSTPLNLKQFDTFRKGIEDSTDKIDTQRDLMIDQTNKRSSIHKMVYNPRKHEKYQKFDMNERQRFYLRTNLDRMSYGQRDGINQRVSSSRSHKLNVGQNKGFVQLGTKHILHEDSKDETVSHHIIGSNKTYQTRNSREASSNLYHHMTQKSLNYEPQYVTKPLSTPIGNYSPYANRPDHNRSSISPNNRDHSVTSYSKSSSNRPASQYVGKYSQPSNDRIDYARSSKDSSISSVNLHRGKVVYQEYDMKKSKPKQQGSRLSDLGSKIEFLKSELKSQMESIF